MLLAADTSSDLAIQAEPGELSAGEVRARFARALRSGNPSWLWPDIARADWQDALGLIETVARDVLSSGQSDTALSCNAEAIGIAAYTSGTGPLLGLWLEQGVICAEPAVERVLHRHLRHNRLRMEKMVGRTADVIDALAREGVTATILKGMHTAFHHFPEPGARPLSDIDILVDPRDRERAGRALGQAGFARHHVAHNPPQENWRTLGLRDEPMTLSFVHEDDPWSIDLQTSLNRRFASGAPLFELDEPASRAGRTAAWPFVDARTLPQPVLLLHLGVHAGCPLISLSLMRVIELVLVIRRDLAAGKLDWQELMTAAQRARAVGALYPAVAMCEQLAPGAIPADVMARIRSEAPGKAVRFVDRHTPASVQQVTRFSFGERYLWTATACATVAQTVMDLLPIVSPLELARIYRMRFRRLAQKGIRR